MAFDRLFKDVSGAGDQSVLDAVLSEAKDVRRQISQRDQRKLDEYLDSVREVEQRISQAGKRGEMQGWRPTLTEPNIPRPADGIHKTSPNTCGSCVTSWCWASKRIRPACVL